MTLSVELRHLIQRYDVFLIDQFGTLHDGVTPYPGATGALLAMQAAGKTVVILSNSGKSGADNAARFVSLGFPQKSFTHFVTSGDVAAELIGSGELGFSVAPGTRCFTISSGNDTNLADRLGLQVVESAAEAELLVISGSRADRIGLETYKENMRPSAERGIPAICTNPDLEMITPEGLAPAAGRIAQLYESLSGRVHWIGKPHRPMYEYTHRLCGCPAKDRIVGIGDSVDHDVTGANRFGIDAVLVRTGISSNTSREALKESASTARLKLAAVLDELA